MNPYLQAVLGEIVCDSTIRAAINTGNPATVTVAPDGSLTGPSVDVVRALGEAAGLGVAILPFASARAILANEINCVHWDIACLAIDPSRRDRLHFSLPYLTFDATYAVQQHSLFVKAADLDTCGVRIASATGAAYHAHLRRMLQNAELIPFDSPRHALAAFEDGGFDALAGVRVGLEQAYADDQKVRILPDNFMVIEHAIAVSNEHARVAKAIDIFMAEHRI